MRLSPRVQRFVRAHLVAPDPFDDAPAVVRPCVPRDPAARLWQRFAATRAARTARDSARVPRPHSVRMHDVNNATDPRTA